MSNKMQLFLFFAIYFALVRAVPRINLLTESLLLYMDKLRDEATAERNNSFLTQSDLITECKERSYALSVYYRMVYFRICDNQEKEFNQFCFELKFYNNGNSTLLEAIDRKADIYSIYGPGIKSNERWLALESCSNIYGYYKAKNEFNSKTNAIRRYPNYTEWFLHATPFAIPVACGFTEEEYNSQPTTPSAANCLPSLYIGALYFTFVFDGLLVTLIFMANLIVLLVSWKTNIAKNTHGQLRISLAAADLLTLLPVCGSINTTYTLYFGPHKFTENGQRITILDYHSQEYVNSFGVATVLTLAASVFTLVALTMDRIFVLFRSHVYKRLLKRVPRIILAVIAFIWILSLLIALLPVFVPNISYTVTALGVIIAPDLYILYVVCLGGALVCVWCLNSWIYLSLRRLKLITSPFFKRSIKKQEREAIGFPKSAAELAYMSDKISMASFSTVSEAEKRISGLKMKNAGELRIAAIVRIIILAFSLAILPAIIVICVGRLDTLEPRSENFEPVGKATWNSFAYLSSRLLFANAFFNCFIYSYKSSRFRQTAKKILSLDQVRKQFEITRESSIFKLPIGKNSSVKKEQQESA